MFFTPDSQKHPPIITFGKPDVVVGGLLRANCTSAPAAPAPRLTWYIDNVKVGLHFHLWLLFGGESNITLEFSMDTWVCEK